MPYIYKITNNINGKIYIGKTSRSIKQRWNEHCCDARRDTTAKRPLYRAINKYGKENFHIELIEKVKTEDDACIKEKYWIEFYDSYHHGYNATFGGDGKSYVDYDMILKLWNEGNNCREISKVLNCNVYTVSKWLNQFGISKIEIQNRAVEQRRKPVAMIDKHTNEVLKIFNSLLEAERFLGKKSSEYHISEAAQGKRKTAYGYKWMFLHT